MAQHIAAMAAVIWFVTGLAPGWIDVLLLPLPTIAYFFLPPTYLLPFPEDDPPARLDPLRFAAIASPSARATAMTVARSPQAIPRRLGRSRLGVLFMRTSGTKIRRTIGSGLFAYLSGLKPDWGRIQGPGAAADRLAQPLLPFDKDDAVTVGLGKGGEARHCNSWLFRDAPRYRSGITATTGAASHATGPR